MRNARSKRCFEGTIAVFKVIPETCELVRRINNHPYIQMEEASASLIINALNEVNIINKFTYN